MLLTAFPAFRGVVRICLLFAREHLRVLIGQLCITAAFRHAETAFAHIHGELDLLAACGDNDFRRLARPAQVAGDDMVDGFLPQTQRHGMRLGDALLCQRAVAVSLDAPGAIPLRLAMAHQDEFGVGVLQEFLSM